MKVLVLTLIGSLSLLNAQVATTAVRFHTNLGDINVNLTPGVAPLTVANFLTYVNSGAYNSTIFHRSVKNFIIQGGGYALSGNKPVLITQNATVTNEFNVSNTRGTIAMAKLGTDANSATDQWFFNEVNNGANLDAQNGGFTVFGSVADAASLAVMDKIAAVPIYNAGAPFDALPLVSYTGGVAAATNYVSVSSIEQLATGILTTFTGAASYQQSGILGVSPGELLVIFGQGIGPAQLTPLALNGSGAVSNSLAGTQVLFDGTPAPIVYTSANQISVIAPYGLAGKSTTSVIVQSQGAQVSSIQIPVVTANPGIFTLDSSGKGDAAIIYPNGTAVSTSAPAKVGDILLLYGEGCGVAAPALGDGAIVGTTLPIPSTLPTLLIDGQAVSIMYAGGAPGLVNGVLQVNFQVPQLSAGSHSIQLQSGSRTSATGVNLQTR